MGMGTNFAHLASFQAIEFMDQPVPKTLDIFVGQASEKKANSLQNTPCCSQRTRTQFNVIPCPRFLVGALSTMTAITTWEEGKIHFVQLIMALMIVV